jgi:uncharacterized damage-inducible protein DinB
MLTTTITRSTGTITATSVAQEQTIALSSVTPTLSQAAAEQTARQQLTTVDRVEGSRLVVFAKGTPRLAWESTVEDMAWGFLLALIHHRGQLTAYLRPMGGKVPGVYGPSADDKP